MTIRDYKGGESTFCSCCFLTTFVSRLLGLLLHHYLGAIVLVEGSQELGHEDHYNAPVQVLPHHGHISHLLYHLKVHLHLETAVLVEEIRELGQEDHPHSAPEASPLRL